MITAYFTDKDGNIVFSSTRLDIERPGTTKILAETLENPQDYLWNGEGFIEKPYIYHTVGSYYIKRGEVTPINFNQDVTVLIKGPGILKKVTTNQINFSSQRVGTFYFDLILAGHKTKKTYIEVY